MSEQMLRKLKLLVVPVGGLLTGGVIAALELPITETLIVVAISTVSFTVGYYSGIWG